MSGAEHERVVRRSCGTWKRVLVTVTAVEGSGPREPGAWMLVFEQQEAGTIGGGRLEFDAIASAREMLRRGEAGAAPATLRARPQPGPVLRRRGPSGIRARHVGRSAGAASDGWPNPPRPWRCSAAATSAARSPARVEGLPFALTWIDSRDEIFPPRLPANVQCEYSDPVQRAVADLAPGSLVLIMSFSHAEDLDILAACLQRRRERADLPFIGLIGSKTKWATFRHRLEQRGFTRRRTGRGALPDRRARHRRQAARGDGRERRWPNSCKRRRRRA